MLGFVGVGIADDDERLFGLGRHVRVPSCLHHPPASSQVKADSLFSLGKGGGLGADVWPSPMARNLTTPRSVWRCVESEFRSTFTCLSAAFMIFRMNCE